MPHLKQVRACLKGAIEAERVHTGRPVFVIHGRSACAFEVEDVAHGVNRSVRIAEQVAQNL